MAELPGFESFLGAGCRLTDWRSGETLVRDDLLARVEDRTDWLSQRGCQRGDRVVVGAAAPIQAILDILACWRGGFVAVVVNPELTEPERGRVDAATTPAIWLDGADAKTSRRRADPMTTTSDPAALILMTSGTTGVPKGITLSLGALAQRVASNRARIGDSVLAHTLAVLPVFFGHGLIGTVLTPLAAGGHVTLWPSPAVAELATLRATLDQTAAGFISAVPSFWRMALRLSPPPARALQQVHIGSEPLPVDLWNAVAEWAGTDNVLNMYGLTEAANWVGGATAQQARDHPGGAEGFVGQPWDGEIAVLDTAGAVQSTGTGEVLLRDTACMSGIWDAPDMTAAAFHDDWLKTGDLGELGATGLTLKGRLKLMINRGGVKILPEEVELMLMRHPEVVDAAAFAVPDAVSGQAVGAAVVLRAAARLSANELRNWCRGQVRAEAVPGRIAILTQLVRNERGKLMRDATRDLISP